MGLPDEDDSSPGEVPKGHMPQPHAQKANGTCPKGISGSAQRALRHIVQRTHSENTPDNTTTKNGSRANRTVQTQPVVVASSWPNEEDDASQIVDKLTEKLGLSYDQSRTVQMYVDQQGKGYVMEKVDIARGKDLRNAGGFFMKALKDDYKESVKNLKQPRKPKKEEPVERRGTDEELALESDEWKKEFSQWKESIR